MSKSDFIAKAPKESTNNIKDELRKMLEESKQGSEWMERFVAKVRELVG